MDIAELRNVKAGQKILITNFYMDRLRVPGKPAQIAKHVFLVKAVETEEKPYFIHPGMLPATGPAVKLVLEHIPTGYRMYLLVPQSSVGADNYIYFKDDEDIPGDDLPEDSIQLV